MSVQCKINHENKAKVWQRPPLPYANSMDCTCSANGDALDVNSSAIFLVNIPFNTHFNDVFIYFSFVIDNRALQPDAFDLLEYFDGGGRCHQLKRRRCEVKRAALKWLIS